VVPRQLARPRLEGHGTWRIVWWWNGREGGLRVQGHPFHGQTVDRRADWTADERNEFPRVDNALRPALCDQPETDPLVDINEDLPWHLREGGGEALVPMVIPASLTISVPALPSIVSSTAVRTSSLWMSWPRR
jgi:hypothetical protein